MNLVRHNILLYEKDMQRVQHIVTASPEYSSRSHFIRMAIHEKLEREKAKNNNIA